MSGSLDAIYRGDAHVLVAYPAPTVRVLVHVFREHVEGILARVAADDGPTR